MLVEEAEWIGRQVALLENVSPAVELGSSTLDFRCNQQPYIERLIHAPLRARGVQILHADYKQADGVDIAGDILDPEVQAKIRRAEPRMLICCNMFEHVVDRSELARVCSDALRPGGYLVLTCPYSYPLHLDPIDTYYRPTPDELAALFPDFDVLSSEIVEGSSYAGALARNKSQIPRAMWLHMGRLLSVWNSPARYRERNHRLLWLFRPYKVTCVVLQRR